MNSVICVSPFDCRMWDMHDRLDAQLCAQSCRSEIESFTNHGQLIPVLGRRLARDPRHKVELIYGARRLFVARHINVPLLVELRDMSDREAIIAMDIENRQRVDVSPYERGLSYLRWLRAGCFPSQEELARSLRTSASQVSRLLRVAQLPPVIVNAFERPGDICEGWGLDISQALEDPLRRGSLIRAARSVAGSSPRLSAREVYRRLMSSPAQRRRLKLSAHDEVVKDTLGRPLFRIKHLSSSIAFVLPGDKVAPNLLGAMREAISAILQRPPNPLAAVPLVPVSLVGSEELSLRRARVGN